MGPKKNRKKDMEFFERVFNNNKYWPVEVKSKFDKNFWFYSVWLTPSQEQIKKDLHRDYTRGITTEEALNLFDAGFIVIENKVSMHHFAQMSKISTSTLGAWGPGEYKYKNLVSELFLMIVRKDEMDKFKNKNFSYQSHSWRIEY